MRLFPAPGPWPILAPIGIRRLSSSNELGAQNVSPHQTTKKEETTPESRVPAWFLVHDMMLCRCKLLQKNDVSGCSARLRSVKYAFHKGPQGTAGEAGLHKKVQNGKASCCTLLKRITKLKCVNSEVRSVDINPTKEVASLGPMAPCRSHHRNHTR